MANYLSLVVWAVLLVLSVDAGLHTVPKMLASERGRVGRLAVVALLVVIIVVTLAGVVGSVSAMWPRPVQLPQTITLPFPEPTNAR